MMKNILIILMLLIAITTQCEAKPCKDVNINAKIFSHETSIHKKTVRFLDESTGPVKHRVWFIQTDDGFIIKQNVKQFTYLFKKAGTYLVILTVDNGNGQTWTKMSKDIKMIVIK